MAKKVYSVIDWRDNRFGDTLDNPVTLRDVLAELLPSDEVLIEFLEAHYGVKIVERSTVADLTSEVRDRLVELAGISARQVDWRNFAVHYVLNDDDTITELAQLVDIDGNVLAEMEID